MAEKPDVRVVEFAGMDGGGSILVGVEEYRKLDQGVHDIVGLNGEKLHYDAGSDMLEYNGGSYCLSDNSVAVVDAKTGEVLRPLGVDEAERQLRNALARKKDGGTVEIRLTKEHYFFGRVFRAGTLFEKDGNIYANKRKCYRGYGVGGILADIAKITVVEGRAYDFKRDMERVRRATHPSLKKWVEEGDGGIERLGQYNGRFKTRSIKRLFSPDIMDKLKEAIDGRKGFSYHARGTRRDYSLEAKTGDDGVYRAWFSSEYAGCGNGDYYVLINPTTALFVETD